MKRLVINIVCNLVRLLDWAVEQVSPTNAGIFGESISAQAFARTRTVKHDEVTLRFSCPGPVSDSRATSFSTKEPETLQWIDGLAGQVLWDIGANVGVYSLYAAKRHSALKVFAFEPSILNTELLARNVALNGLADQITMVPIALSETTSAARFSLGNLQRGGAQSAFGVSYGYDGKPISEAMTYGLLGVSIDDLVEKVGIPAPNAIKMDVDGIEHLILRGATRTLRNPTLTTLQVEINDAFEEQRRVCGDLLTQAGFALRRKEHAAIFDNSKYSSIYNTVWERKGA